MASTVDRVLLSELALPIVVEVGVESEDESFAMLSDAYFADPARALAGDNAIAGPLAVGTTDVVVFVTPVVLAALNESVQYVVGEAAKRGLAVTGRALRRLFGREAEAASDTDALELTDEQWAEIHRIVLEVARRAKVPAGQARLIADAVVGRGQHPTDSR